jgi:hypothetical protein
LANKKPLCYASDGLATASRRRNIRELQEYRTYVELKDTCLHNGDTLHVEFADAALLKKSDAVEGFLKNMK